MNNANTKLPEFDTYLFDADGTLIDTAALIIECFLHTAETLQSRLIVDKNEITADRIKTLMGLPLRCQMELYFGPLSDDDFDEITNVYRGYQEGIYTEYLSLFPGVKDTLAALKAAGKKLAIVTSRRIDSLSLYTETTGIAGYFDEMITPASTEKHKPNPEPVLEALKQLNSNADKSVYIGDALYDVQAGKNAGVSTVYVNWGHVKASDLEIQPDYCIDRMEELLSR